MKIETLKRGVRVRAETKLQAGDILRWCTRDQTAALFRPDTNGHKQTLYNHFWNNDKYRFPHDQKTGHSELAKMVADCCGLNVECDNEASGNGWVVYVFKERTK